MLGARPPYSKLAGEEDTHPHVYVYMFLYTHAHIHIIYNIYIYIYIYIYVCVCFLLPIHESSFVYLPDVHIPMQTTNLILLYLFFFATAQEAEELVYSLHEFAHWSMRQMGKLLEVRWAPDDTYGISAPNPPCFCLETPSRPALFPVYLSLRFYTVPSARPTGLTL